MILPHLITFKFSRYFSLSSSRSSIQNLLKRGFTPTLISINNFLLFLSRAHRDHLIINFLSQMDSNQIKANSQTHLIFTWALLKLNKFEDAEHFIKTRVAKSSNISKHQIWDSLIRGFCVSRNDPEKAFSLLEDGLRDYGLFPSSFTFCSLIFRFSCQGKMGEAIEVLEVMSNEKVKYPYNNFLSSSIISGFCKIGKPELGVSFFENAVNVGALRPNLVTYTALATALCMLGRVDEVSDLVCRMEKEGLAFDVVFYSSWFCGYFRDGLFLEAFQKHREMVEKGIDSDVISYTILIDGLSKMGEVEKAVGFFKKMRKNGLKPNLVTYTAIILGFCKKGKMSEAFAVFRMVEDLGIEVDEITYAILIDGFCKLGDFDRVHQLLEEMEKKEIIPSIVTYNTLINGLCKVGRTSDANEVSKDMVGDVVTYSTLLHGYIEEKNVLGVSEIKRRFEEAGVGMDVVMCNILIKALLMVGAFEDAYTLYKRMQKMDLIADSVTYCTLIHGYCKVGRIDEALEIFDEHRRLTASSVACYNSMITGLCKSGMVDVATEVFIELSEKVSTVDVVIYSTLIKTIMRKESAEGVLNLIYRIENLGLDICDSICNFAIRLLCKRKFSKGAMEVYSVMRRNESVVTSQSYYSILKVLLVDGKIGAIQPFLSNFLKEYGLLEPSVSKILLHYLCLRNVDNALYFFNKLMENNLTITFPISALKALAKEGRVLAAYKLFMGAKDKLPAMDVFDYSIIVDGLCKGGHPVKALDICAFAEKMGVNLSIVTYNSVINGLCHQGCLVEAFRLFDSLERIGLIPSEITYGMLIDNLCKEGYFVDAKQLSKRMILKGYKESTRTYNSFLCGYCKFGRVEEALKILNEMEINCLNVDEFTVSALINGYCKKGNVEGALLFFDEYRQKGVSPDFLGFLYLIRGLYTMGRMEETRSILREMLLSHSVIRLMNRVNYEVETESIKSILSFFCEQGSLKEVITVLEEIGSMFFPTQGWCSPFHESQEMHKLPEMENFSTISPRAVSSNQKTCPDLTFTDVGKLDNIMKDSDNLRNGSEFDQLDTYCSLLASLCSRGNIEKANILAKKMLGGLCRDC